MLRLRLKTPRRVNVVGHDDVADVKTITYELFNYDGNR